MGITGSRNEVKTYTIQIVMGGDLAVAKQVCREFCMPGLCVTIDPTHFIYTGGEETGIRVGLINYPRFPSEKEDLLEKAQRLANILRTRLCQHSYTIITPDITLWNSLRDA